MPLTSEGKKPRVLVVEDRYLIAMQMKAMIEHCGCTVVGPVATRDEALEAVGTQALDAAVLDAELFTEHVWPVADRLEEAGVPFIFASGQDVDSIPSRFAGRRHLMKPVDQPALRAALAELGLIDR